MYFPAGHQRYKEEDNMGFVWYGENKEHWNSKFIADVFYAKGEILSLLKQLKVMDISFKVEKSDFSDTNINIYSKKTCIGFIRLLNSKRFFSVLLSLHFCK